MSNNKIIFLSGATDGIGKRTALRLAEKGETLIMHGRNKRKGEHIKRNIIKETRNPNIFYFNANFASFLEIKKLSEDIHKQFSRLDIIINNAGIFNKEKVIINNGIEETFMVNHLAPFSLSLLLRDLIKQSNHGHILNVSSMIHAKHLDFENINGEKRYIGEEAYSQSKLCNILFTYKLSNILEQENTRVNALHPGVINTKLLKAAWGDFGSSTEQAAKHILHLVYADNVKSITAKYFMNDKLTKSTAISYNKEIQNKLWDISLRLTKHII